MSVALKQPPVELAQPQEPSFYRLSVKQYHRMIEVGVLTKNDRVELIDGLLVPKMTHNPPHDATVSLAHADLYRRVPPEWLIRVQSAISAPTSEPEPDVVVARGPARRYVRRHPRSRDIALLVEVSDATLAYDQQVKGWLYARLRIPVYWIINLVNSRAEVYTEPKAGKAPAFRRRQDYGPTDSVPVVLLGQEFGSIPVRDLLP
jgi:Uma2 family endonuclease